MRRNNKPSDENIKKILNEHKKWIETGGKEGEQANLTGANLSGANLFRADLSGANLSGAYLPGADLTKANLFRADLSGANLSGANLSGANLFRANLSGANLSGAYLPGADLTKANLFRADLSGANLSGANLSGAYLPGADLTKANLSIAYLSGADLTKAYLPGADLSRADLSGAKGLISPIDYILENFEKTEKGIIVYKAFGAVYRPPDEWIVEQGSIIEEIANFNRADGCGCGTNVAPKEWVFKNYPRKEIWKCLIKWEWLSGVCVPYNTDGKIRCSRLKLLEKVEE